MGISKSVFEKYSVEDVKKLIQNLGAAYLPYAENFEHNGIDGHYLCDLKEAEVDETLKTLGIKNLIHCRNLRKKLKDLQDSEEEKPVPATAAVVAASTDPTTSVPIAPVLDPTPVAPLPDDGGRDVDGIFQEATALHDQGEHIKAKEVMQKALLSAELTLGPENAKTLTIVQAYANILYDMMAYDDAKIQCERALRGREKVLPAEHPDTLASVAHLGELLHKQGQLSEAKVLLDRALLGCLKVLGADDVATCAVMTDLGNLLSDQGKHSEARGMHEQALAGFEKTLGESHPQTMNSAYNVAIIYHEDGDFDRALSLYIRVLVFREQTFGPDQPDTLMVVNNLGMLHLEEGELDKARVALERTLAGREKALGPTAADTLSTVHNLAVLSKEQGRLDEAKTLYEKALRGREATLGAHHADTIGTVIDLASTLLLLSNQPSTVLDEAEILLQRALSWKVKKLGYSHSETLTVAHHLGQAHARRDKWGEAKEVYERALKGQSGAVETAGNTIITQPTLTCLCLILPNRTWGTTSINQTVDTCPITQFITPLYPATLLNPLYLPYEPSPTAIGHLKLVICVGNVCVKMGLLDEAQLHFESVVRANVMKNISGWADPVLPDFLITCYNLAGILRKRGQLNDAKKLFVKCMDGWTKIHGPTHADTIDASKQVEDLSK